MGERRTWARCCRQGTKNNIHVTTALQSFGMIVTAEPYFSVTEPSDVVVIQNVIRPDKTNGVMEKVNANYYLLPRGAYAETAGAHTVTNPITRDEHSPLEMFEADNAVRIAQDAGADQYAPEIMLQAKLDLQNASDLDRNKHGDQKMEITDAREAVERAEDARIASLRKQAAEQQAATVTSARMWLSNKRRSAAAVQAASRRSRPSRQPGKGEAARNRPMRLVHRLRLRQPKHRQMRRRPT